MKRNRNLPENHFQSVANHSSWASRSPRIDLAAKRHRKREQSHQPQQFQAPPTFNVAPPEEPIPDDQIEQLEDLPPPGSLRLSVRMNISTYSFHEAWQNQFDRENPSWMAHMGRLLRAHSHDGRLTDRVIDAWGPKQLFEDRFIVYAVDLAPHLPVTSFLDVLGWAIEPNYRDPQLPPNRWEDLGTSEGGPWPRATPWLRTKQYGFAGWVNSQNRQPDISIFIRVSSKPRTNAYIPKRISESLQSSGREVFHFPDDPIQVDAFWSAFDGTRSPRFQDRPQK